MGRYQAKNVRDYDSRKFMRKMEGKWDVSRLISPRPRQAKILLSQGNLITISIDTRKIVKIVHSNVGNLEFSFTSQKDDKKAIIMIRPISVGITPPAPKALEVQPIWLSM